MNGEMYVLWYCVFLLDPGLALLQSVWWMPALDWSYKPLHVAPAGMKGCHDRAEGISKMFASVLFELLTFDLPHVLVHTTSSRQAPCTHKCMQTARLGGWIA